MGGNGRPAFPLRDRTKRAKPNWQRTMLTRNMTTIFIFPDTAYTLDAASKWVSDTDWFRLPQHKENLSNGRSENGLQHLNHSIAVATVSRLVGEKYMKGGLPYICPMVRWIGQMWKFAIIPLVSMQVRNKLVNSVEHNSKTKLWGKRPTYRSWW